MGRTAASIREAAVPRRLDVRSWGATVDGRASSRVGAPQRDWGWGMGMSSLARVAQIQREVPLLRSTPIVGAVQEIRRDYLGTVLRAAGESDGIARIQAGPPGWRRTFYSVSTPDAVSHVLGQPDQYTKDTPAYRQLRAGFGNGMLTSEGEQWRCLL